MTKSTKEQLFEEILRARTRVYRVGKPTPLQELPAHNGEEYQTYIKREDLGPINAYKWRGAYNAVLMHHEKTGCQTVVAASAGNHAQGVALAARILGLQAKIFMPLATPMMKQVSVKRHGGDHVEIILTGDTYNEAGDAAKAYVQENGHTYIHPFDDLYTMAGQATIADEIILSGKGPFDYAFVQIGGGGMAAAVASWLKMHWPSIHIVGVEGVDQASMKASVESGQQVTLNNVDTFCDGTAVSRPGDLTFEICKEAIDSYITVTNEEVSGTIQRLWDAQRVIPEPSGAMGLAGLLQFAETHEKDVQGKKLLSILCGANMDFSKLSQIAARSAIGAHKRRYMRFSLQEGKGSLLDLLDNYFNEISVSEFLFGKNHPSDASMVIAMEASEERFVELESDLSKAGIGFEDVTLDPDVRYKIINYNPALFDNPLLMHIHFPERKGALRDFLRQISGIANICYFNYAYSGEAIGRALMGFEFASESDRDKFHDLLKDSVVKARPVDPAVSERILKH